MDCSTPRFPVLHYLPEFCSNSCLLSRWRHPVISSSVTPFSSCPQSFPASGSFPMSQLFTSGGQGYWSFSFSISLSNEYSGLISFRIDWLDVLAVQKTLKSLLQHHSSFVSKVMFLLFNTLSRFIIAFLPKSKHLLISWVQSPSAVKPRTSP